MENTVFDVKVNDKEVKLRVLMPSGQVLRDAQLEYARMWSKAVKAGAMLKAKLDTYLREQNLWDDEKQNQYIKVLTAIADGEKALNAGRIKLSQARDIALSVIDARSELMELLAEKIQMETNTAEGQAENARFNYILSCCLVYNDTGKPFYQSVEELMENSASDVVAEGSRVLANIYMGLDNSLEEKRAEMRFLKRYKLIDKEGRLLDREGNFVNRSGQRVDEEGRLLNEEGKPVNADGEPFKTQEEIEAEFQPFLDDDGNPIIE